MNTAPHREVLARGNGSAQVLDRPASATASR